MKQTLLSLVIPTIGRVAELEHLLESIVDSKDIALEQVELIIVDQNQDQRLQPVLDRFASQLNIQHVPVTFKGAARARNHGAKMAVGEFLNFPDDDAHFDKDSLSKALNYLQSNPEWDAVSGRALDPDTDETIINYLPKACWVSMESIQRTTIEFTLFFRKASFDAIGGFDPELGPGRYYGVEEGADLIIRMLNSGTKIRFEPDLRIFHPANREMPAAKFYRYARGSGRLFFKHRSNPVIRKFGLLLFLKSLVGFIIYIPFTKKSRRYLARAAGIVVGYVRSMYGYSEQ